MARWGKNIVVPLDSLCKEKENTNRPTVARSVGTVGKWGKMGFTSTRTYSLTALPASMAAAAAAAASPGESPASLLDDDMSPSVPEPPKPKKFFKSRNTAPPEVIAQLIQQLPRLSTSPIRDSSTSTAMAAPSLHSTPVHGRESIKLKIPKSNSAERKKKSPKKSSLVKPVKLTSSPTDDIEEGALSISPAKPIPAAKTKKKEEKKLKPEAPPSRIIPRARKAVNYCEVDEDDRMPTPSRNLLFQKHKPELQDEPGTKSSSSPSLPPPSTAAADNNASKTPEHPPIVLRISKGTSRLVSTDSDEQTLNAPIPTEYFPHHNDTEPLNPQTSTVASEIDTAYKAYTNASHVSNTPKIIVKPPRPPTPQVHTETQSEANSDLLLNPTNFCTSEINYSTVKISPDKPPKERLKLIIKGDVIRNAIAAAAAAAKAARTPESSNSGNSGTVSVYAEDRPEKEKKTKSKKHKHTKHDSTLIGNQLRQSVAAVSTGEFKTPSPHLALGNETHQLLNNRSIISPSALSERDFDSQSSVLGSTSSKGNSTPQIAPTVVEESCVFHSRGSSVITSDLETSQHSSLVAPPSDIESRLESMMMDDETTQRPINLHTEEPLQEDILAVLQGDESQAAPLPKFNGTAEQINSVSEDTAEELVSTRRVTRGRNRGTAKTANYLDEKQKVQVSTRTRIKKQLTQAADHTEKRITQKRSLRRGAKKPDEEKTTTKLTETDDKAPAPIHSADAKVIEETNASAVDKLDEDETTTKQVQSIRRSRMARNVGNNNNLNNNNINKIAANLSAKAGAAVEALNAMTTTSATATMIPTTNSPATTKSDTMCEQTENNASVMPRIYCRKRKNQQVMHLVHTSTEDIDESPTAPKVSNISISKDKGAVMDVPDATMFNNDFAAMQSSMFDSGQALSSSSLGASNNQQRFTPGIDRENNSNISRPPSTTPASPPAIRDYKIKDKFKRTLTLDNQAHSCNAMVVATSTAAHDARVSDLEEEDHQRVAVKLVISKKKGSIFKSRALAPTVQSEQASSTKRHLYKHRWNAEANGVISNEASTSPPNANDTQVQTMLTRANVADNIFDDFSDAAKNSTAHRDNKSPILGKLTRVVKPNPQVYSNPFDMEDDGICVTPHCENITSVKVDRKAKDYYTVVRNVKTAHQIQEIGEYQEMDDDVEYILDALQPHNPTPTRCLSALQLATKCMTSAFRMHVRAHGIVTKFFKALSDANTDLSLGLCTSTIMYILSQEGLNMDLDRDSLELMMNLLESETVAAPSDRANYERNKQKVRELCEEIKAQGKATHLNMDSITVGTLAMETLLSLTSKRAGEWFKDELRELGGLEHIIKTISECCRPILMANNSLGVMWTQPLIDNMQTVLRCLRVLENVTQMNEENQKYILTYAQETAVDTLLMLYSMSARELKLHPTTVCSARDSTGVVIRELLIHVVKVLITLTHTFNPAHAIGAEMLGNRTTALETSLHLIMQSPNYIPERSEFELCMLVLSMLINITMHCKQNRTIVMNSYAPPECALHPNGQKSQVTAIQAIMDYFWKCEEMAMVVEENADAYLDKNKEKTKKKQEEVDETVNNLLASAGTHMEHTLKCSYVGILVGNLVTDSEEYEAIVRTHLRGNGFKEIIAAIDKYHTFMNLTGSSEVSIVSHNKDIKKLMDYLKKRDLLYEMDESADSAHPLNLEKHNTQYASTSKNDDDNDSSTLASELGTSQRVYKTYSQR